LGVYLPTMHTRAASKVCREYLMERFLKKGQVVSIVRNTLERLEQNGTSEQNGSALLDLKRQLILAVAECEMQRTSESSEGLDKPVLVLRVSRSHRTQSQTSPEPSRI
jgi:hypothetical protein